MCAQLQNQRSFLRWKRDPGGRPDVTLKPDTSPRPKQPTPDDPDDTGDIEFEFESDPGREYCLERAENLEGPWEKVTTVIASGESTTISDLIPADKKELFWRLCVEEDAANDPLEIGEFAVAPYFDGEERGAEIGIEASSGPGITAVNVFNGNDLLGKATDAGDGSWRFRIPLNEARPEIYELRAEVVDENKGTAVTEVERLFLADPLKFVPYDPATGGKNSARRNSWKFVKAKCSDRSAIAKPAAVIH